MRLSADAGWGGALVAIRPNGTRPPLYCVPAVSGSPYAYNGLVRLLDPQQPVYGFEAPGCDNERTPMTSLPDLASVYIDALRANRDGPYHLLGWSMGGVVALEMARRLVSEGAEVPLVVIVDSVTPQRSELPAEPVLFHSFLYDLVTAGGMDWARVEDVARGDTAESAFAAVERSGLLPEEIDAEYLLDRYAVYRAHMQAVCEYEGCRYGGGPVVSIRAAESSADAMRWELFAADVEKHVVDGDHHSIWTGTSLVELSRLVGESLDRVGAVAR
ncbi:alpha/beta fold hydrolase [Kutzneria sp. 744]|uniref:thioesterase domain-containing protein n=1 Tax=Kutzneria sp. (strain 744) TaxID=345341 RepID=UPI0003EEBB73|nr:alpha/beta fold hydrolase [Kutzneria sp. 744]EWM18744.1 non-ribosomal peptide synthetase [Kutzneria sp. 744]